MTVALYYASMILGFVLGMLGPPGWVAGGVMFFAALVWFIVWCIGHDGSMAGY